MNGLRVYACLGFPDSEFYFASCPQHAVLLVQAFFRRYGHNVEDSVVGLVLPSEGARGTSSLPPRSPPGRPADVSQHKDISR